MSTRAAPSDADRRARFEVVAAEIYEPLQRYLRRRARSDDAADVLADTLLVVWRRLDDVPPEPLPWCIGVALRNLANHRRGDDRRLRLVERTAAQPRPETNDDPQLAIERGDPELAAAIGTLSESEAEIVRLWAWERLEPREIATALDVTPNAVSVALSRAKRKLGSQLGDHRATDRIGRQADTPGAEVPPGPTSRRGGAER
ncbi:MAG: sigma-70 family RNA polymerase sigma factor [Ilumatobacteraceae bacterium]|nr:sigma-70 family RNA polymerase sigma factor [Ilumatobacteraceae bacterium]